MAVGDLGVDLGATRGIIGSTRVTRGYDTPRLITWIIGRVYIIPVIPQK